MANALGDEPDSKELADISSNFLFLLNWAAQKEGVQTTALFRRHGIEPPSANNPKNRVPVTFLLRTLRQVHALAGSPISCISAFGMMRLVHLNALGFSFSCSNTLLEVFQRAHRFSAYLSPAFAFDVEEFSDHYFFSGRWNASIWQSQLQNQPESNLMLLSGVYAGVSLLAEAYGGPVPYLSIELPGDHDQAVAKLFSKAVNCPIAFGQDCVGARVAKEVCLQPLPCANPALASANDQTVKADLGVTVRTDLVHPCEQAILKKLRRGEDSTLASVASALGMSQRVLQRKLRHQGVGFAALKNRLRKELAAEYLAEEDKPISFIAHSLGFEDRSSFSRAFRAWSGRTPQQYRRGQ